MLSEKVLIIHSIIGLIRKIIVMMSQYFLQQYKRFGGNVKVELYLSSYETKVD